MPKTVVVLGAGVGGLSTASRLRELLANEDRLILVDRSFEGVLGLSLLWVLRGWRSAEEVLVHPSKDVLPGIEMVTAEAEAIDVDRRVVTTNAGELSYDALVVALGAAINPGRVPGLEEALDTGVASEFYSLEGATDLHARLEDLKTGRLVFVVAGVPFKCPAAPFEAAFLAADLLRSGGEGNEVTIDVFTPDPLPMQSPVPSSVMHWLRCFVVMTSVSIPTRPWHASTLTARRSSSQTAPPRSSTFSPSFLRTKPLLR